jgi:carbamoyltransferase
LGPWYKPWFVGPEGVPALWQALANHSREDIAAAAQRQLELVICAYVERFLRQTGLSRLALAGGVFGNVKVNQRLRELSGVTDVYVHPNMGDGGLPLGGALAELAVEYALLKKSERSGSTSDGAGRPSRRKRGRQSGTLSPRPRLPA